MQREYMISAKPEANTLILCDTEAGKQIYQTYLYNGQPVKWSGAKPLPEIGTEVLVTMNSLGRATVTSYFIEHGFIGIHVQLHNPPAWWDEQRKRERKNQPDQWAKRPQWSKDGIACVFGAEIKQD